MAGMWQRFKMIFNSKANAAMNKAEDPAQTLDYSYEKQLEMLQKVRRGVADVATSRKRVELQIASLDKQLAKLDDQARAALAAGREDLAREALIRKSGLSQQIADLHVQLEQLTVQEQKLTVASQQLQTKVEAFRTQKETIKATYSAAEAQVRINEAFTGISSELGDVGLAIQRAEDRTAQMQARAGAMEELMATGALRDVTGGKDSLTVELERLAADSQVENELAAMKAQLGGAEPPAAVTGAAAGRSPSARRRPTRSSTRSSPRSPAAPPSSPARARPPARPLSRTARRLASSPWRATGTHPIGGSPPGWAGRCSSSACSTWLLMAVLIYAGMNAVLRADHRRGLRRGRSGTSPTGSPCSRCRRGSSTPEQAPQLHAIVDRLCAMADMPKPRVGDRRHRHAQRVRNRTISTKRAVVVRDHGAAPAARRRGARGRAVPRAVPCRPPGRRS